jgi:hypothetical protein
MNFLGLINEVLIKLREDQVAILNQDKQATLIGRFVNDAKRVVEDAWSWDVNNTTISIDTVPNVSKYTVTGAGLRQKDVTVNNSTNRAKLQIVPKNWILDQQQLAVTTPSQSGWFAWDGNDGIDAAVQFYPTPNAVATMNFNMNVPQIDLVLASDILRCPWEPVVAQAYARALVERGEDGGLASSEAYGIYKGILADRISLDSANGIENDVWVVA